MIYGETNKNLFWNWVFLICLLLTVGIALKHKKYYTGEIQKLLLNSLKTAFVIAKGPDTYRPSSGGASSS